MQNQRTFPLRGANANRLPCLGPAGRPAGKFLFRCCEQSFPGFFLFCVFLFPDHQSKVIGTDILTAQRIQSCLKFRPFIRFTIQGMLNIPPAPSEPHLLFGMSPFQTAQTLNVRIESGKLNSPLIPGSQGRSHFIL